jgi:hypothetical protein
MTKLEEKKKLLVAESEVYRQLLKMELQTIKVYGIHTKRRMTSVSGYLPFVMSGLPFLSGLFGRRRSRSRTSSLKRMISLVMIGWKAYQRFGSHFNGRKPEGTRTAAEEFLSKRL